MINALDVLRAATLSQHVDTVIANATATILTKWRTESGKTDPEVLREKLIECGWKYSRQQGRWHHPKAEGVHAPRDLSSLAKLLATAATNDALKDTKVQ